MDVRQKVIIVTGASAGIELATARLLAKQDAKVTLAARFRKKRPPAIVTTCRLTLGARCCFLDEIGCACARQSPATDEEQCSSGASDSSGLRGIPAGKAKARLMP